jgi:hypothetical protein
MSQASSNGQSWENSVDFDDDPYEREWVKNIIFPPSPKLDDSDDENDSSFVEPSLWSYRR